MCNTVSVCAHVVCLYVCLCLLDGYLGYRRKNSVSDKIRICLASLHADGRLSKFRRHRGE